MGLVEFRRVREQRLQRFQTKIRGHLSTSDLWLALEERLTASSPPLRRYCTPCSVNPYFFPVIAAADYWYLIGPLCVRRRIKRQALGKQHLLQPLRLGIPFNEPYPSAVERAANSGKKTGAHAATAGRTKGRGHRACIR